MDTIYGDDAVDDSSYNDKACDHGIPYTEDCERCDEADDDPGDDDEERAVER